jgi:hypothetical protein
LHQQTPTLGGKETAAATQEQQQQQHAGDQLLPASQQQQHAHNVSGAAPPASHARHRLANISNLPQATPVSAAGGLRKLQRGGDGRDGGGNTSSGPQPMQTGGTTARPKRRHVMFQAGGLRWVVGCVVAPSVQPAVQQLDAKSERTYLPTSVQAWRRRQLRSRAQLLVAWSARPACLAAA